jgi:FKBP-type peptidyl-prolyl cis-trans isomerase
LLAARAAWFRLVNNRVDPRNEGEQFLEENSRKAGIQTNPSGLQYEALREGQPQDQAHGRIYTLLSEVLLAGVGPGDDELREE